MNKTLRNLALVALATAPFAANAELVGEGTAANPYLIGSAADLCEAYQYTKSLETVYFVQTADIDMAGVKEYIPVVGYDAATYDRPLNYDGRNHVIKNFAPETDVWASGSMYNYGQSIFGVFSGELKNLGIVDMNISAAGGRCGAIGGYLGQSSAGVQTTVVSNVYVTGKVKGGSANYSGGLFGTTGTAVELNNCFVNVEMEGLAGGLNGALAGRLNNPATFNNCYVAGTVSGNANLVCAANKVNSTFNGFVVFNSGSDETGLASADGVTMANTEATSQAGLDLVRSWAAYSATEDIDSYPALMYALSGEGTEANPYIIDSPEALCNAYRFVDGVNGGTFYFVQTADIDMEGFEDYHALAGYDGAYKAIINYDGQNHVIKNFVPLEYSGATVAETNYYYCTSIFGVPSGVIKNLGVVDAYVSATQGAGVLGAYAGHGSGSSLTVENVFVTGEVYGEGGYTGGLFGTTGNLLVIKDSFFNGTVNGSSAYLAGFVGRLRNEMEVSNSYIAGTVQSGFAVADTDKAPVLYTEGFVSFVEGAELCSEGVDLDSSSSYDLVDGNEAALIEVVQEWAAFSSTEMINGYPALDAFDNTTSGIFNEAVEEVEANGPAVYYNLQGVQVANPENGVYIVRRGNKVSKELVR